MQPHSRSVRAVLAVLGAALLLGGTPGAADAATGGSTHAADGVLFEECFAQDYAYDLQVPSAAVGGWDATVALVDPAGTLVAYDFLLSDVDPGAGTSGFTVCGAPPTGTYTLKTSVEWSTGIGALTTYSLPYSTFVLRAPHSHTHVTVSTRHPRLGQVVRLASRSTREAEPGDLPAAGAHVKLQRLLAGRWVTLPGARAVSTAQGRTWFRLRFDSDRPVVLRVRTLRAAHYDASSSRRIRLH